MASPGTDCGSTIREVVVTAHLNGVDLLADTAAWLFLSVLVGAVVVAVVLAVWRERRGGRDYRSFERHTRLWAEFGRAMSERVSAEGAA